MKNDIPIFKEGCVLAVLLVLYIVIASLYIRQPGLHYDEMLFVNAALGGIDSSFIVEKIGNVPVYLCSYMGALKAYLYYPIFALFGVSAASVRLPMILITAVGLLVLFLTAKKAFSRNTAWIVFLLLISNPSIMFHTRTDNGPTAIQFFLTAVCLYLFSKAYDTRKKIFLAGLYCTCWLGVYYNIKFIWFVNSIFFITFLLYLDTLRQKIKMRNWGDLLKIFMCFVFAYLPFFIYTLIISSRMTYPLVTKTLSGKLKLNNIFNEIQGGGYYELALGPFANFLENPYLILIAALLAAGTFATFLARENSPLRKKMFFLWVMLITTGLHIYITPQARKAWHAFKIYPWITLLLAICIVAVSGYLKRYNVRAGKIFTVTVLIVLVGYNTAVTGLHIKAFREGKTKPYWSEAVYDVIDYTGKEKGRFFSCTWGIHNQLISFHKDPYRFQEIFPLLRHDMTEQEQESFYNTYLKEHQTEHYFIVRPAKHSFFKKPRETLFAIAEKHGISLVELRRFRDSSDGQDIFILYRIKK